MEHRVLVVDDEKLISWSIKKTLVKNGFRVETAANGRECQEKFRLFQPDLVILDIWLPDINGLTLLEQMKELKPKVPVLMLTAYSDSDAKTLAMGKGAYTFIGKPFDMGDLVKVSRCALQKTEQGKAE